MTDECGLVDGVLYVPEGTKYIRSQEYAAREDIRRVVIPRGVGFMEDACFAECPELESAELPEGLVNIGPAAFAECPKLRKVNIPSTVRSVDSGAFLFCESLTAVTLPEGLEAVCELAFQGAGLEKICVPASVKTIDESAFFSCEKLRRADVLGEDTAIGQDAFGSNYQLIEGYIAPGYPEHCDAAAELLYTLLWCSCPDRHGDAVSSRAEAFIRSREELIMERILKYNNVPAMTGLAGRGLLSPQIINSTLQTALKNGQAEITALLLKAKNAAVSADEEFDL